MSTFTVRPSNSEKEAFRVKLTAASLLSLKLKPGDVVLLQLPNDNDTPRPAIAWENSGNGMKDNIVQTSKLLQELYGFKLGDKIGISRSTEILKDISTVTVRSTFTAISDEEQIWWQRTLSAVVPTKHDILTSGQKLTIEVGIRKGEFDVVDVGGLLGRITDSTHFVFGASSSPAKAADFKLDFTGVGGLKSETLEIQKQVDYLQPADLVRQWSGFQGQHGLLLYGPKGVGKTLLQDVMAKSPWSSVIRWSPGIKLPPAVYPRLIITDLHDAPGTQKITTDLISVFREIQGTQTLVIAETRHPNDVSERLRTQDTFAVELELPIPDLDRRHDILQALRAESEQPSDQQLHEIAARTHGFVGMDLKSLLRTTWVSAYERTKVTPDEPTSNPHRNNIETNGIEANNHNNTTLQDEEQPHPLTPTPIRITQADINHALTQIRPSALQQVFLEKPNVHWSDIGGQHSLKRQLTNAVARTLSPTLRTRMSKLGVEVTKGVLLHGPPGCSKTLLAKALATEAELNFLAVKGAELISMYVGESERATREVFRKARAAAPSILFFDEIDAIASRKKSSGGGGDLNVLTTLLNEMDGFEELRNVIVVAATNKPWDIDPALLRPGRFDNVVYVDLPDADARREIWEKRLAGLSVCDSVRNHVMQWTALTAGFSGAEVVAICKAAGENAMDAERDEIVEEDVRRAIDGAAKGVTKEMLDEYQTWNKARSASTS